MLQWRNWHTRQIQTLFSPGSTPGWSTIFEINSGGDFVNNISAVAIGMLIAAGGLGAGGLLYALGCLAMMGAMMLWMNHGNRGNPS